MKSNKFTKTVTTITLLIMLMLGVVLIFNEDIGAFFIRQESERYQIASHTKEQVEKNQMIDASFDVAGVEPLSSSEV